MRSSSNFLKLSGALVIAALLIVSLLGYQNNVEASRLAQATATMDATSGLSSGSTGSSNTSATMSATSGSAGMMTFAACPPSSSTSSTSATMSATSSSMSATMNATMSATSMASGSTSSVGTPGFLGIQAAGVDNCGIRVVSVLAGSPATTAGLQAGDVIVAVNGQAIGSMNMSSTGSSTSATAVATSASGSTSTASAAVVTSFFQLIQSNAPGSTITLTIQRNGSQLDVPVTLGTIPAGLVTPAGGATSAATVSP